MEAICVDDATRVSLSWGRRLLCLDVVDHDVGAVSWETAAEGQGAGAGSDAAEELGDALEAHLAARAQRLGE